MLLLYQPSSLEALLQIIRMKRVWGQFEAIDESIFPITVAFVTTCSLLLANVVLTTDPFRGFTRKVNLSWF